MCLILHNDIRACMHTCVNASGCVCICHSRSRKIFLVSKDIHKVLSLQTDFFYSGIMIDTARPYNFFISGNDHTMSQDHCIQLSSYDLLSGM